MLSTDLYLEQLQTDKQNLVSNLNSKGVEASETETFTSLVPKVMEIPSSLSGIPTIEGTEGSPIIIADLELGVYVLSGIAQSSLINQTQINLSKRVYSIVREDDTKTIIWDANPYAKTQLYILFYHNDNQIPSSGSYVFTTAQDVQDIINGATIDGGNWINNGGN